MDKTAYQKDVKYLGYNINNNNKNKNYYYNKKHKNSDYSDNSQFSWRKNSGASKVKGMSQTVAREIDEVVKYMNEMSGVR